MKDVLVVCFAALAASVCAAKPEVSGVTVSQDRPGEIGIAYSLSDGPAIVTAKIFVDDVEVPAEKLSTLTGDLGPNVAAGSRRIVWKARKELPGLVGRQSKVRAELRAYSVSNPPDYLVIPLVTNAYAKVRFYESASDLPGGLGADGDDCYRTNCLVMRRIRARGITWTSGSHCFNKFADGNDWYRQLPCEVKLQKDYWIGVYELTSGQYDRICKVYHEQVYGVQRDVRPCDKLYYREMRIMNGTVADPQTEDRPDLPPGETSALGRMRAFTGLSFDFPTESEWEFAAKAGTTPNRWNTGAMITNETADANCPGRYLHNGGGYYDENEQKWKKAPVTSDVDAGTAKVGSYAPNAFGLYDMHGNVMEWCRDFSAADTRKPVHLKGALNATFYPAASDGSGVHILRGGYFPNTASHVFLTKRTGERYTNSYAGMGCRLVLPLDLTDELTGN